MANIIKPKRSSTGGAVPTTGQLASGEMAINMADKKVYINNGSAVVQVGSGNLSGLNDVSITTPSNGQSLAYNSTSGKWENSAAGAGDVVGPSSATDNALVRFDGTTGKLIQNSTATVDDNGNFAGVNSIGFDTTPATTPTAAGSMFWDADDGTPSVVLDNDVTLQLGQENIVKVYNGSGSTITNGKVVAVNGAQGQRPSVTLADADTEALSAGTLGIATEDIANGAEGFVTTFGLLRGLDTSAFSAGAPIYLSSTAGSFTATRPAAPAHTVFLGWVVHVNASSGEVFVNISNGWELDELHNVLISSPVSGNTLVYDASVGVWKNASLTAGTGISVTNGAGSITIANTAPDQTVALTGAGATTISGTYPNFTITSVNTTYNVATSTVAGLIELWSDTQQSVAANAVTATASRTYGLQLNASGQGVVNVPWTDTVYTLPAATSTVRGGIELGSDTAQTVAANAVTATASRSYALQVNASGQGVVNVPWTDTNSGGTVTSVAALTLGTTGTDLSSTVANGTTTPVITLNVPTASATNRGVLSAADWTTFNNKTSNTGTVTNVATGTGLTGGPITSTGTISLADTAVTAGSYTNSNITVDAQGRITAASNGTSASGTVTSVSGTGTVSGLTLTGTVTTSGSVTLGGNLSIAADMIYDTFTATASQTTFTTSATYTSGKIEVFVNGVKVRNGTDVTVTSGTSVVMASGLPVGTLVDLVYPI